jgi:hypothetical protein
VPAWIPYTLLRLALFGGTFALVFVLLQRYGLPTMMVVLVAAIAAVIVSLTVAYIFFPSLRDRVSTEFAASRDRSREKAGIVPDGDARGIDERAEDGD